MEVLFGRTCVWALGVRDVTSVPGPLASTIMIVILLCRVTLCATVDVQTERHSALELSRSRLLKEAYHGPCHGAPFCEHCSLKGEPPKYNVPHVYHVPSKSLAHALTPPLLSMWL